MPELPEVEIIRLNLTNKILGLKIQKIQVLTPKSFIGNSNLAQGQKVLKVWRVGKMLGIYLENATLLIHLKMSGQLIYENGKRFIGGHPTADMENRMPILHTRVIFSFSNGSHLYFNDQRRFGWVRVLESGKCRKEDLLKTLGPEPLNKDFTWKVLKEKLLKRKSMPVKTALMDQAVVAGIGNIYSNEACFLAKINPVKKVCQLSDHQFQALCDGVIKAIKDGIKYGGSTRVHFVDPDGHKGYFLDYAFVYDKDKHPCKVCGTIIEKIQVGGRGTYFCRHCQL